MRLPTRLRHTPLLAAAVVSLCARLGSAQVVTTGKGGGSTPLPDAAFAFHALDRLTFGHTPAELARLRELGFDGWLREQLEPELIPESPELLARLAALPPATTPRGDPQWYWKDLYADDLLRKRYSRRQLREVMAEFWSNHFNTSLDVARAGQTGFFASLAFDGAGNPIACGYDGGNSKPRCALWSGSGWSVADADPWFPSGWFTSLRLDPSTGQPAVAYYEPSWKIGLGNLRLARRNGSAWVPEVVDSAGDVGAWSSLRFDSRGTARIAYQDKTAGALKLATRGSSGWNLETVESGGVGMFASLALDSAGLPLVAYLDVPRERIRLARHDGARWTYWTVASVPLAGFDLAAWYAPPRLLTLEVDPATDLPVVAWYDVPGRRLRIARFDGSAFRAETVDASADVGLHPSLAFDPITGRPAIAYQDRDNWHLKLARALEEGWVTEVVDGSNQITGDWASLVFDDAARPRIAYFNGSTFSLELATWQSGAWLRQTIEKLSLYQFIYAGWEREESARFRALAFGRFRDLLGASATSPAMMLYLNNNQNTAGAGNENYARELLELHTVGVDGGYDQADVEILAQALTGWTITHSSARCDIERDDFCYNHLAHDGGARTVLGIAVGDDSANVPGNWMRQGEELLDRLACHPATARFLCQKLIEKFVDDEPPPALWSRCVESWLASDGDIRQVLETLLRSAEFRDPALHLGKVRTPLEFALAPLRHLSGATDGVSLVDTILLQGAEPFRVAPPTGYAERGDWWTNSNTLLQRWKFAEWLSHSTAGSRIDPAAEVRALGLDRADAVVEHFLLTLVRGEAGAEERSELLDCLNGGDPGRIDLASPAVDARLRDTVEMILGFPVYNKQ